MGHGHIAATVSKLVFAYAGASLPATVALLALRMSERQRADSAHAHAH